jgi:hypothetical protein
VLQQDERGRRDPETFRTKKASARSRGIAPASPVSDPSIRAETTSSTMKATNHGMAARAPRRIIAQSGATNAHSETALDSTNPPRLH